MKVMPNVTVAFATILKGLIKELEDLEMRVQVDTI